jgi:hypothetical protein
VVEYDKAFTSYSKSRSTTEIDKKLASAAADVEFKRKLAISAFESLNTSYITHQALQDKASHMKTSSVVSHDQEGDDDDGDDETEAARLTAPKQKQLVKA